MREEIWSARWSFIAAMPRLVVNRSRTVWF
jgi:hypothetical protein